MPEMENLIRVVSPSWFPAHPKRVITLRHALHNLGVTSDVASLQFEDVSGASGLRCERLVCNTVKGGMLLYIVWCLDAVVTAT